MHRDEDEVRRLAQTLDASATIRIVIYLLGIVFAAALIVWQVRSLAAGQEEIRRDLKLLTDPANGLMVRFSRLDAELQQRITTATKEHLRYESMLNDQELRIRALEVRRANGKGGR